MTDRRYFSTRILRQYGFPYVSPRTFVMLVRVLVLFRRDHHVLFASFRRLLNTRTVRCCGKIILFYFHSPRHVIWYRHVDNVVPLYSHEHRCSRDDAFLAVFRYAHLGNAMPVVALSICTSSCSVLPRNGYHLIVVYTAVFMCVASL